MISQMYKEILWINVKHMELNASARIFLFLHINARSVHNTL